MRRKTPQEKKRLSYVKDRRNNYGENDKSSRKNIRRNKHIPNSANRRRAQTSLAALLGSPDDVRAESVEDRMNSRRPRSWKKWPDAPLGVMLVGRLQRRTRKGMTDGEVMADRVNRVRGRSGVRA
ncbi:hypothetical protein SRB5_44620 [Streptomyces sp. RB5]|uniref:Uncharacterized protein n=1 Tax=Streptomyces smaragdinus TaxID=2585196 RepID=A0A7K0CLD3_9ACTN|nr:hypothetical protein [Streptomyces smaragdinus]MQY14298.1 hypothetical protein [Streptomyces smaragdinus]